MTTARSRTPEDDKEDRRERRSSSTSEIRVKRVQESKPLKVDNLEFIPPDATKLSEMRLACRSAMLFIQQQVAELVDDL
jgi:hypothetical protein